MYSACLDAVQDICTRKVLRSLLSKRRFPAVLHFWSVVFVLTFMSSYRTTTSFLPPRCQALREWLRNVRRTSMHFLQCDLCMTILKLVLLS